MRLFLPTLLHRLPCWLSASLMFAAVQAWADCPKPDQGYAAHVGDINGDNVADYAVVPRPTFVPIPIDDDLMIIVPVPSRAAGFALVSGADGARTLQALNGSQLPPGDWTTAPLSFLVADLAGTGCAGLVVRGMTSGTATGSTDTVLVRFSSAGQPAGTQVITSRGDEYGLSAGELGASDQNGDGRRDLVHRVDGLIQTVYLADAQGIVQPNNDATIMAVWGDFVASAAGRDPRAKRYLAPAVVASYADELTTDALEAMCRGLKAAGVESSDEVAASVVVQRIGEEGDDLYTVLFGRTEQKSWRIAVL